MGGPWWRLLEILHFLTQILALPASSLPASRTELAKSMNGRIKRSGHEQKGRKKKGEEGGRMEGKGKFVQDAARCPETNGIGTNVFCDESIISPYTGLGGACDLGQ